ncbi:MAG: exodeoxyribonuclease VII large subunit [Candidatus Eisenbacteria bacterium]
MSRRAVVTSLEREPGEPRVWTVSEAVRAINAALEDSIPNLVVQGEISEWKPAPSGHLYFTIKDADASLRVILWKGRVRREHESLRNGLAVQVEGHFDVYAKSGGLSLVADRVTALGYGALQAQFDALKRKLQAEGLFDEGRKRPLPRYPTRVGMVTSPTGAAVEDMLRILRQRAPYVAVTIVPTPVQGEGAAAKIADAIALLNEWGGVDVMIVGRGGGSAEDLWAFNEEAVVRAIAGSRIPVVSAVGHEVDVTLADFAADRRAATPTHAAQQVAPSREEATATLDDLAKHARHRLERECREARTRLRGFATHHAIREPLRRVRDNYLLLDQRTEALQRGLGDWVIRRSRSVEGLAGRLRAHTPKRALDRAGDRVQTLLHRAGRAALDRVARGRADVRGREALLRSYDYHGVLRRGYALVWAADGRSLVQRAEKLKPDATIEVQFEDARAEARVTRVPLPAREETP